MISARQAFTLVETMISMAIFTLVVLGMVSSHMFGMRLYELSKAKLGASDEARTSLSLLLDDVRAAKIVQVGQGDLNSFTECADGAQQRGNAVQVYPTTNLSVFTRYYCDSADNGLKRMTSSQTNATIILNAVSNSVVFTTEDAFGHILTNIHNNRVVGLTLQIYQLEYPAVTIGPGGLFNSYQLRSKMTRRTLE